MSLGPTGARGGNGGNVYVEGVSDLGALQAVSLQKEIIAQDGENGKKKLNDGTAGEDIILKVPVGTVLHNLDANKKKEITKVGEKVLIAAGGFGGHGNYHFRSGKNTSPRPISARFARRDFYYAHGIEAHRRCRFHWIS